MNNRCGYCGRKAEADQQVCVGCGLDLNDSDHAIRRITNLKNPIRKWGCYVAAISTGIVIAICTAVWIKDGLTSFSALCFMAGFNGVFMGAFFIPNSKRRFRNRFAGSFLILAFLLVGLVLYVGFDLSKLVFDQPCLMPDNSTKAFAAMMLAGLVAAISHGKMRQIK